MSSLYLFPPAVLVVFPLLLTLAVISEILVIFCGFYGFTHNKKEILETIQEVLLFVQLVLVTLIAAQAIYHAEFGFFVIHRYAVIRYVVAILNFMIGIYLVWEENNIQYLFLPLTMGIMLPFAEDILGTSFCYFLLALIMLWICRAVWIFVGCQKNKSHRLSAFSVKEATDAMRFGLLFCKNQGNADGQILLCNRQMEVLMNTITGTIFYDGKDFYQKLVDGVVLSECHKYQSENLILYRLPNATIWEFALYELKIKHKSYALLIASDDTAVYEATEQLREQNAQLKKQNQELTRMLQEMESTCKIEESIYMKGRIHDLLGQKITLLLRSMREHKPLNQGLLSSISKSLSEALKEQSLTGDYSMKMLIKDFKGLGVKVKTKGCFPKEPFVQKAFFEIAMEAMTNAVKHGYATKIWIESTENVGKTILTIRDNGLCSDNPIIEGGGFSGMRRKAQTLGGTFSYKTNPQFTIQITILRGG